MASSKYCQYCRVYLGLCRDVGAEGGRIGIVEDVWEILTSVSNVTGNESGGWGWVYGN